MKSTQFFLAFLTLILCSQILSAQEKSENDKIMALCCDSVRVEIEIVDCCIKFYMLNEHCNDSKFEIQQWSTTSNSYITKEEYLANKGDIVTGTLCPDHTKMVKYRIQLTRDGIASCAPDFIEGHNQFSGDIDMSHCCGCPENRNDWLITDLVASDDCPDGCKVTMRLQLGDSSDCYRHYAIITPDTAIEDVPIDYPISNFDFCLTPGETSIISFYLQIDSAAHGGNECEITKTVTCDTTGFSDTLLTVCKPDCFDDEWKMPPLELGFQLYHTSPSCSVHVEYTTREACDQYQDLQILSITFSPPNCNPMNELDKIYKEILYTIISTNDMNFHPRLGETRRCDNTWRVFNGSCWASWVDSLSDPGYPFYRFQNCKDAECCKQQIEVCRNDDESVDVTAIEGNLNYACDSVYLNNYGFPPFYDPWMIPCTPVCLWLDSIDVRDWYLLVVPSTPKFSKIQDYDQDVYLTFREGNLVFLTENNLEGNIEFSVFTSDGRKILSKDYDAFIANKEYILKFPDLSTGMYFYTLDLDGVTIKTGSVPIVK